MRATLNTHPARGRTILNAPAAGWQILCAARPNVLVMGPTDALEQVLAKLIPHLRQPVREWTPDALRQSPADVKTLVIRGVDALSGEQQRNLSAWLERSATARPQVVSTTTVSLFHRIATGLFLEELYYRLNILVLRAQAITDRADRGYVSIASGSQLEP
jgi:hypothetical protein